MGEAARKLTGRQAVPVRPQLRLVSSRTRPASRRRSRAGDASAAFRLFCAALVLLALVGMLRITLAVQAQEAAIDANALRQQLKAEEQVATSLEADRSALAAPSRIESIASAALNMSEPAEVCYIDLPSAADATPEEMTEPVAEKGDVPSAGIGSVVATLMDVAAGEAQVLLVGDVGIASAK